MDGLRGSTGHPPVEARELDLVRSRLTEAERVLLARLGVEIDATEGEPQPMTKAEEAEVLKRAKQTGSYSTARLSAKVTIWEDTEAY